MEDFSPALCTHPTLLSFIPNPLNAASLLKPENVKVMAPVPNLATRVDLVHLILVCHQPMKACVSRGSICLHDNVLRTGSSFIC